MKLEIRKDKMGFNWLLCAEGLVLAFGAQKSFPTEEDAREAYKMITDDLLASVSLVFTVRGTIGLYALITPEDSPLRFATLHDTKDAAIAHANRVLTFIEVC